MKNDLICLALGVVAISASFACSSSRKTASTELPAARSWKLLFQETFEGTKIPDSRLKSNSLVEPDPFSDDGEYFHRTLPRFKAPRAYRANTRFGKDDWLQIERYSREENKSSQKQYSIVKDPENPTNHVLRLSSFEHTDGVVVRPSMPLPPVYRVCVRAGYVAFGNGKLDGTNNGYKGSETAEPWIQMSSTHENGVYWLAILDAEPRPRNNVWIHHHRKAVIDSDNNWYPQKDGGPWSRIFDGKTWIQSGENPVMMFILDGRNKKEVWDRERTGRPFISWSNHQWNYETETSEVRAADAYLDKTWYDVCIEKTQEHFTLSMKGKFRYGGETTYSGTINRTVAFDPQGSPDYFMFGDPHVNFYRGHVHYDDVRLYVPEM